MLSWVEHEKKFYNLRARLQAWMRIDSKRKTLESNETADDILKYI